MRFRAELLVLPAVLAAALVGWALASASALGAHAPPDAEQVVLLHGLGRTKRSMSYLAQRLLDEGFEVVNIGYPSRSAPPDELIALLRREIARSVDRARTVHFVAHSLGGVLVRAYLGDRPLGNLGRVVMLGTPSRGSEIVDRLGDHWLMELVAGPTGTALGTSERDLPRSLGRPYYELGVIAGNFSFNPIGSRMIPGDDDGFVGVDRTRVEGMKDHLVVPVSHTFLLINRGVADQVVHFLREGRFVHQAPPR